jgi:hypothetical protein
MEPKLIKIDRNGSKHFEGWTACDRCGGGGIYTWGAVINGRPQYAGTCFKCEGHGKVLDKWIERTPEYEAKLAAKRKAKQDARAAEWAAEQAKREAAERAQREAEEARIRAEKAISQYVGQAGDKVDFKATYIRSGSWEQKAFRGYGTDTMFCHTFKDEAGNVFTWKTQKGLGMDPGQAVQVKGTVKQHSEYKDEKQTELTRCKITAA